jgi:phosphoribosylformylglycinamidine synthase
VLDPDVALFSESCGRFVVTTSPADAKAFAALFNGLACWRVGLVTEEPRLRVKLGIRTLLDADVLSLKSAWKETLARV